MQIIVSNYGGTGEGTYICILITLDSHPNTAFEKFKERFGDFHAGCAENITKDYFMDNLHTLVPEYVLRLLKYDNPPCNWYFAQEWHENWS